VRLDHLLSKEQYWPWASTLVGVRGPWLMLRASVSRVGLLMGGALVIRFVWFVSVVGTALGFGVQEDGWGGLGGLVTLLGPEGTGTVLVSWSLQALLPSGAAGFGGGGGWRAGRSGRHTASGLMGCWWGFGVGGGGGLVSVRVLRTA
jgi:hypothetical protein